MLKIEKSIQEINFDSKTKQELLNLVDQIKSNQTMKSPDAFVTNIAKSFASQNSALIESSGIIPEILMQKNFKIIDFLINTKVIGVYFVLGFILLFGWFLPIYGIKDVIINGDKMHWKNYCDLFTILGLLAYYRFLWKKLMP